MTSEFVNIRKIDNFYQTSSFFPMPVVLISTISENGGINIAPYSLCFPYIIAKDHAMMLICRKNSNTAINIFRTKVCAINFIENNKKYLKNCVMLGYPGESTEEKMKNNKFNLIPSQRGEDEKESGINYPDIVTEAFQVFECTWDESYDAIYDEDTLETHFVLKIDKILLKASWKDALFEGKKFPDMPIDFGFRNNGYFWFASHSKPYSEEIPKNKGQDVNSVMYIAQRTDPDIKWEEEACAKLIRVPRIFLKKAVQGCVDAAREEGITIITPEFMDRIRDKRSNEKKA